RLFLGSSIFRLLDQLPNSAIGRRGPRLAAVAGESCIKTARTHPRLAGHRRAGADVSVDDQSFAILCDFSSIQSITAKPIPEPTKVMWMITYHCTLAGV